MYKTKHKFSVVNIVLVILIYIILFAVVIPQGKIKTISHLTASSVMTNNKKPEMGEKYSIIPQILPVAGGGENYADNTPVTDNYTPKAPILTREYDKKIKIKNDTGYEIDIDELLSADKGDVKGKVLILHTHTSEAYTMEGDDIYEESDPYRTQNSEKNIVRIGSIIAEELEKRGIEVIHDKTYHDYPSYTGSYKRALATAQGVLKDNEDIILILDVHRDAIISESGEYMKTYTEINGEGCAQALIVVGSDAGGLEHKNWRSNLKYGLKIQERIKSKYPSLVRDLHLCCERYNGHMGEGAMIIEIGSNANTLSEAEICARLVGECIADFISLPESR